MKLKIFDYLWHIPHQYDLMHALKDDCEFYFCLNIKTQWDPSKRVRPENLTFVPYYEPGKYDVAILHVDQQVVSRTDRKRQIYDSFNSVITDIPKIVINHGSPVLTEWFRNNSYDDPKDELQRICVAEVRSLIGNNTMIVNSYAAASLNEWGWGTPIIHGIDPYEWYDHLKEPRIFTAISAGGFDEYYNRECLTSVSELLAKAYGYTLYHAKINIDLGRSPEDYKRFLGSSLLYFDPSFRTPMNRARTEALLSGCCVIQVEQAHDLERWAVNGENMVIVPNDPLIIARTMVDYLENRYEEAVKIGQNGRSMAIREFAPSRLKADWLALLNTVLKRQ